MAEKGPSKTRKTGNGKKTASKRTKDTFTEMPIRPEDGTVTSIYPEMEEAIRRRAYELYEERGRHPGFHEEDWKRAEEEVRARYQREKSA
jgi:Protein of unknown function (DUF2934)